MTIISGFFNSLNGDRRYAAEDFAFFFSRFIGNGVFPEPSYGFQVMANQDMSVTLKKGDAWINGYFVHNSDDYRLEIPVADGVLNRIDRIVLQLNYEERTILPVIKKGGFGSSPVPPSLQRDADAYEIALADIYVGKGSLSLSQATITDQRLNSALCGIVHGTVDQVDTTSIFNQYLSWFKKTKELSEAELTQLKVEQKQEFREWFDAVKDHLSGDIAGNLQNQITVLTNDVVALKKDSDRHQSDDERHITSAERQSWNNAIQNAGSWKKVADVKLTASTGYVALTNIPSHFTKFKLLIDAKSTSYSLSYVRVSVNDRSDVHHTRIIEADKSATVRGLTASSGYGAEIGISSNVTATVEFSYTEDLVTRGTFQSAVSRGSSPSDLEYTNGAFQAQTHPVDAVAIRASNALAPFSSGSRFVLLALA